MLRPKGKSTSIPIGGNRSNANISSLRRKSEEGSSLNRLCLCIVGAAFVVTAYFGLFQGGTDESASGVKRMSNSQSTTNDQGVGDSSTPSRLPPNGAVSIGANGRGSVVEPTIASTEGATYGIPPEVDADGRKLHVIFSTDCSEFQHWQSYLVFFSALKVQQPGHVTRIASGCTDEETEFAQKWHDDHVLAMSSNFHLHFTPKFTTVVGEDGTVKGDYKFFNKPLGLKHWLENGVGLDSEGNVNEPDTVVLLIDPDMAFHRPLLADYSVERETLFAGGGDKTVVRVEHGHPFGQKYGLGTQWQTFDLDKITGDVNSPAKSVTKDQGRNFYPAGPPYMGTAKDMYQIALHWSAFAPKVHAEYPYLLAEMYAYCIAAAHLNLPHRLIVSGMISNVSSGMAEGWPFVDKIPSAEICSTAANPNHSKYPVSNVIHYCQRYFVASDWFFSKRYFPKNFFECSSPLLEDPPAALAMELYQMKPPGSSHRVEIGDKEAKRNAFVICALVSLLNDASIYFKSKHCHDTPPNLGKTTNLAKMKRASG